MDGLRPRLGPFSLSVSDESVARSRRSPLPGLSGRALRPGRGCGGPDPAASRRRGRRCPARAVSRRRSSRSARAACSPVVATPTAFWASSRRSRAACQSASALVRASAARAASAFASASAASAWLHEGLRLLLRPAGHHAQLHRLRPGAAARLFLCSGVLVRRRDGQAGEGREAGRRHVLGQPARLRRQRSGAVGGQRVERAEQPLPHVRATARARLPSGCPSPGPAACRWPTGASASAARHRPRPRRAAAAAPAAARRRPSAAP